MSNRTVNINVHHVTRVEGHGNIVVNATNGKIEKLQWQVPEAPRFFEAMVRGRSYEDIQTIVSRICGICSISHSLVATKAVENATGIQVSEQTDRIRLLLHYSEQLQSHVLHVGYLVAPDLFGVPSVVPLVGIAPGPVKTIIGLHRLANEWSALLAGRITHPVTLRPGGLTKIPTEAQLRELQDRLRKCLPDLKAVADVVLSVAGNLPKFERPTEYVSLKQTQPPTYAFYHGEIASTDAKSTVAVNDWKSVANEYVNDQSTAKWAKWHRDSYAVGALARFNNNAELLSPTAKAVAKMFGLAKGCCNPYFNSVAQIVEAVHVVEVSIALIDTLLTKGLKAETVAVSPKAGKASGAVEAPRGILFHEYEFDRKGNCMSADLCIPTNQNHANIQKDIEKLVPEILDEPEDQIRLKLEMLVRSYDPCVSCSTHMLDVEFVR
ncbi:MAG: Ni/Fe hydrogenase subunit alpha [Planctomycetes bacterium]|jgi:coenzyme F420-reducing hydrogenase alpha subunit|nr:Ni/Fe hydrogenase subunit alpha [Planctomycetota bacterium]